jgi:hypothetical protein
MAQRGMLSRKPTSSMMVTISSGRVVSVSADIPEAVMIVEIIPCATLKSAVISSIPWVTAAWASTKRIKHLNTISGFFNSVKLEHVFTIPITKNSTSRAQPMAWSAPLMSRMTDQTAPPLKFSGLVESSVHISASFPFQVPRAELRLSTIQFLLPISITSIHSEFVLIFTPNSAILLAEGGGVDAKYSSYFRFAQ